jgi:hypothetical protein
MWGHLINGPACSSSDTGLWPTPVAHDDGKSPEAHLAMKARMPGGPRSTITSLTVMVKAGDNWPTPTTRLGDDSSRTIPSAETGAKRFAQGRRNLEDMLAQTETRLHWPTPTAGDASGAGSRNLPGSKAHPGVSLTDAVVHGGSTTPRNLDDPRSRDRLTNWATAMDAESAGGRGSIERGARGVTLSRQVEPSPAGPPDPASLNTPGSRPAASPAAGGLWPTPQAYAAPEGMGKPTSTPLDRAVTEPGPSRATKGGALTPRPVVLNPRWVLALMGFPTDWLDGVTPPRGGARRSRPPGTPSSLPSATSSPAASESSPTSTPEAAAPTPSPDDPPPPLVLRSLPDALRDAGRMYQWLRKLLDGAADEIEALQAVVDDREWRAFNAQCAEGRQRAAAWWTAYNTPAGESGDAPGTDYADAGDVAGPGGGGAGACGGVVGGAGRGGGARGRARRAARAAGDADPADRA